jgi:hypothetical protein
MVTSPETVEHQSWLGSKWMPNTLNALSLALSSADFSATGAGPSYRSMSLEQLANANKHTLAIQTIFFILFLMVD